MSRFEEIAASSKKLSFCLELNGAKGLLWLSHLLSLSIDKTSGEAKAACSITYTIFVAYSKKLTSKIKARK